MRVFVVAVALSAVLSAAPSHAQAQAPAPQAPVQPAPAAQAPAQRPPFQAGLKYGYVRVQEVVASSSEGKALSAKVQALQEQKLKELQDKNKALQATQEKLDKGASVLNDQARAQLQAEIERQQRDIQRFTEDAQQEIAALGQQLQLEFERKLTPVIDRVAKEKELHFIFNGDDSGLIWADPTMDLTLDVIRTLDSAATAKPAAAAPAPPAK